MSRFTCYKLVLNLYLPFIIFYKSLKKRIVNIEENRDKRWIRRKLTTKSNIHLGWISSILLNAASLKKADNDIVTIVYINLILLNDFNLITRSYLICSVNWTVWISLKTGSGNSYIYKRKTERLKLYAAEIQKDQLLTCTHCFGTD